MPKTDQEYVDNHMEKNMQMKWRRGLSAGAFASLLQGCSGLCGERFGLRKLSGL